MSACATQENLQYEMEFRNVKILLHHFSRGYIFKNHIFTRKPRTS